MPEPIVILVTAASEKQAREIAQHLLEQKLIACANLLPVQSLFLWEGQVQDEAEVLMIIKSTSEVFKDKVISAIRAKHSYDVPEIIAWPIVMGADDYINWIADSVTG